MRYKQLGKTGVKIPAIGLGTWLLSSNVDKEVAALKTGLGLGMRLTDTAEIYGTEPIVAKAIEGEKDVFVATKVTPIHFRYDDVIKACERSLAKLRIKVIDLYQLHWPNSTVPIAETMRAMEKLVADGKIRYIGVSNFDVEELKEAQSVMKSNEIASNQVEYSVIVRDIEKDLLGYCAKEKITVIAYSPFAHGALYAKKYARVLEFLAEIGKRYNKTATQVALNWLISKNGVVAIPKASDAEHVKENAGAGGFALSQRDVASINDFLSRTEKQL